MPVAGQLFIGLRKVSANRTFRATNPETGEALPPDIGAAGPEHVEKACALAASAADACRALDPEARARFLEAIAGQLLALGDELTERAHAESGLPMARLDGERGRTIGQLRLFADELRRGGWLGIRLDPALPEREPLPRPDLRQRKIPLGPVAVFGAGNFPLAFSVAGGDTAAALAAGCPVIAKGHPAHPGTGDLVAQAVVAAAGECGMPEGVFSMLNGDTNEPGAALVAHPEIKAVGFTGSRAGGLALVRIASRRPEPIPVYAEMSSINPVILLPAALAAGAQKLAEGFLKSLTMGAGQFCTNPGLVIAIEDDGLEEFIDASRRALEAAEPEVMLTEAIHGAYEEGVRRLLEHPKVRALARGTTSSCRLGGRGALFAVAARGLLEHREIMDEVFGASSVVVRCADERELRQVLEALEGQLTVSLHVGADDTALAARLLPTLERKAGRLVANGWPTGVEVSHAMVHGGPYPATSDGRSTSVGTLAIERFLRPVCYQDMPAALLPAELRDDAPERPRRVDGRYYGS